MIVFEALIIVLVILIWKFTYPKVSLWIDRKTSINLKENFDKIKNEKDV